MRLNGVGADGAVSGRPDGYVAWRSRSGASNPLQALRTVIIFCFVGFPP